MFCLQKIFSAYDKWANCILTKISAECHCTASDRYQRKLWRSAQSWWTSMQWESTQIMCNESIVSETGRYLETWYFEQSDIRVSFNVKVMKQHRNIKFEWFNCVSAPLSLPPPAHDLSDQFEDFKSQESKRETALSLGLTELSRLCQNFQSFSGELNENLVGMIRIYPKEIILGLLVILEGDAMAFFLRTTLNRWIQLRKDFQRCSRRIYIRRTTKSFCYELGRSPIC